VRLALLDHHYTEKDWEWRDELLSMAAKVATGDVAIDAHLRATEFGPWTTWRPPSMDDLDEPAALAPSMTRRTRATTSPRPASLLGINI